MSEQVRSAPRRRRRQHEVPEVPEAPETPTAGPKRRRRTSTPAIAEVAPTSTATTTIDTAQAQARAEAVLAAADHRPDIYLDASEVTDDDGGVSVKPFIVVRASSLGRCERSLIAAGMGMDAAPWPENLRGRMDESSLCESVVLDRITQSPDDPSVTWGDVDSDGVWTAGVSRGMSLRNPAVASDYRKLKNLPEKYRDDHQFALEWDVCEVDGFGGVKLRVVLRGHLDGIVDVFRAPNDVETFKTGDTAPIEAKAFGPDMWKTWKRKRFEAFPGYALQLSEYGHGIGAKRGVFVVGEKLQDDDGNQLYTADGLPMIGAIDVVLYGTLPVAQRTITTRVKKLAQAVASRDLPDKCDQKQWPCGFFQTLCNAEDKVRGKVVGLAEVGEEKIAELAEMLAEAEVARVEFVAAEKRLKDLKKELNDAAIELAGKNGTVNVGKAKLVQHYSEQPARTVEYKASVKNYSTWKLPEGAAAWPG